MVSAQGIDMMPMACDILKFEYFYTPVQLLYQMEELQMSNF